MSHQRDDALIRLQRHLVNVHRLVSDLASMPPERTVVRVRKLTALEAASQCLLDALTDVDDAGGLYPPTGAVPSAQLPALPVLSRLGFYGTGGGRLVSHKAPLEPGDNALDRFFQILEA